MDETRDLVLERDVEVTPEQAFRAWTEPALLVQWFTPEPWKTVHAEVELRPGGRFATVMQSPKGQRLDEGPGCILEVVPGRRFTWTSCMGPDFRPNPPAPHGGFQMTATLTFEPRGTGARYRAVVRHASPEAKAEHEAMGFHEGWGKALDQLVTLMRRLG
ncbi:MAG: hypothetical protein RL653_2352 [Pseudomonadota bacterium]